MPKGEASLFRAVGVLSLSRSTHDAHKIISMAQLHADHKLHDLYIMCSSCSKCWHCQLLPIDHMDFSRHSEAKWGINSSCVSVGKVQMLTYQ